MDAKLSPSRTVIVVTGAMTGSTLTGMSMRSRTVSRTAGIADAEARVPKARTAKEAILENENMTRCVDTRCEGEGPKDKTSLGVLDEGMSTRTNELK